MHSKYNTRSMSSSHKLTINVYSETLKRRDVDLATSYLQCYIETREGHRGPHIVHLNTACRLR